MSGISLTSIWMALATVLRDFSNAGLKPVQLLSSKDAGINARVSVQV
ncbi:MAG: hypothetical protein V4717_24320 [Bacteroidota bacterium]